VLLALYLKASIHQKDRKYISSLRNNLINEFKPKTPSALLILDVAVSAYFRVMRSSAVYNALIQTPNGVVDWTDKQRVNLIKELNKQIDIANQQLISFLNYLKETNPQLPNIKVQTKNAFIAQNQQFNTDTKP